MKGPMCFLEIFLLFQLNWLGRTEYTWTLRTVI